MESIRSLLSRRDFSDGSDNSDDYDVSGPPMSPLLFTFSIILLAGSLCVFALFYIRSKRLARQQALLPVHRRSSHHRTLSIANFPTQANGEAIFVYDEKMNLIANSSEPPSSLVPEIHITFPDEEDPSGKTQKGRVVVVHVTDSGSIGMAPLNTENLPPYQQSDADRFHSLDLDRLGGLKEQQRPLQRWS